MQRKPVILFLCTGNSCRSQMAEAFACVLGGDEVEVYSAGIEPAGLNPRAVASMKEVGIDISGQSSNPINPEVMQKADIIITLCGDARDKCPVIPSPARHEHWPLIDPAQAEGGEEAIKAVFRAVREEIRDRVANLLRTWTD